MGRNSKPESTLLILHAPPSRPAPRFLGLVPEPLHPYLELIRLEKVLSQSSVISLDTNRHLPFSQPERNLCFGPLVSSAARHTRISFH